MDSSLVSLDDLIENEFFDSLEKSLKLKIPEVLRNILIFHDFDSVGVFSRFDEVFIDKIQTFMRLKFNEDMVPDGKTIADFLGKFSKNQTQFQFTVGQRIVLEAIMDFFKGKTVSMTSSQYHDKTLETNVGNELTNNLPNYIGSLMITVYNDAKRKTLSAHSWPSRHVASEMANHFKINGNLCTYSPRLEYITPANHGEFINCIVQGDLKNLAARLKDSLALSLRVDGSVDRTQDHNIYVLANVVHKNGTMDTSFIGFDIPKAVPLMPNGKPEKFAPSLEYYNCVKSIANNVVSWDDFIKLISSLVTDGETLNTGNEHGLWARLQKEAERLNLSIITIWCVAHRLNLAWKDLCRFISLIADLIKDASGLSTHFHTSGERTHKLHTVAIKNKLTEPLRYLNYFEVRWTQYTFDLFSVTLRNWRAAMLYFIEEREIGLSNFWLLYDRIRLLAFLTDILSLLKTFQKTFESDTVSILVLQNKKQTLCDRLLEFIDKPKENGWEQEFLSSLDLKDDGKYFFGHKLLTYSGRSNRLGRCTFTELNRKRIIETLINLINERMSFDLELQDNLKPLAEINRSFSRQSLQLCHKAIIPDLNEEEFYVDYALAGDLLNGKKFDSPLQTLGELIQLDPDNLMVLKTCLARVAAAKPHSSDVERIISKTIIPNQISALFTVVCSGVYNLLKDTDRASLGPDTLFNYLYINMNMPPLHEYDPGDAVKLWMQKKKRCPHLSNTAKQQEWFRGVFADVKQREKKVVQNLIKF